MAAISLKFTGTLLNTISSKDYHRKTSFSRKGSLDTPLRFQPSPNAGMEVFQVVPERSERFQKSVQRKTMRRIQQKEFFSLEGKSVLRFVLKKFRFSEPKEEKRQCK